MMKNEIRDLATRLVHRFGLPNPYETRNLPYASIVRAILVANDLDSPPLDIDDEPLDYGWEFCVSDPFA